MAHFGSIQMGILITLCSLHTDLPICSSWQISFSCFKSSDLFFWLNPWAFLLFSSAFNSFIVIFEDFRIIRACGFWKGSFTWLPVRVTCMPFLSAFFNVLIPLSVVSLFISMSLSLSLMISQLLLLLKNISSRVPFDGLSQDYTASHIIVSLHHLASKNLHRLVELQKFGVVSNHDVHVWCNPSFLCKEVFWLRYSWMCSWNRDFTELT